MSSKLTTYLLTIALLLVGTSLKVFAQDGSGEVDHSWWIGVALGLGSGIVGFIVYKVRESNKGKAKKQKKYLQPVNVIIGLVVSVMLGCIALNQLIHMNKVEKIEKKKPVKLTVEQKGFKLDKIPLVQAKANHETELNRREPSPDEYDNEVPDYVKVVHFPSEGRQLLAWVLRPKSKGKHPAVLYAHDGGALGKTDLENAKIFAKAGFIVMLPSWRGENGNSGNQEMCYGEVDDAVNAIEYLSKRKAVDNSNIFAFGHGVGATVAMLLAESSFKLNKVAACGGYPNMFKTGSYPNAPFKTTKTELRLRSPAMYVRDLNCPMLLMYGDKGKDEREYLKQAREMDKAGAKYGKKIRVKLFTYSDHDGALEEAVPLAVKLFSKGLELRPDNSQEEKEDSDTKAEDSETKSDSTDKDSKKPEPQVEDESY